MPEDSSKITGDIQELEVEDDERRKPLPYPIACLGASAGGLEALIAFFENMPADAGVSFIVIQHLAPDTKSLMPELLSRHTRMPVHHAEDGMALLPNVVHLLPPKMNMHIYRGRLALTEQDRSAHHGLNLPIDIFMRSLARDQGKNAIGVILSGTGSDGVRGVRAVKEAGGMVMVQTEESAQFDGMPRSAIATGLPDFVLTPDQMPSQLISYVNRPPLPLLPHQEPKVLTNEENLSQIVAALRKHAGVDFSSYKPSTVVRRIERRMGINQIDELEDYVRLLERSKREVLTLYRELLIGVTKFFRDGDAFDQLDSTVIPGILDAQAEEQSVRAWITACSTGEEAYSIAMLFAEHLKSRPREYDVKIFATDIDRDAIAFASAGLYPESVAADISAERLARFFTKRGDNYQVSQSIREMVIFAPHNLLKDPPFSKTHLISCRNILIYLQPDLQRKLINSFHFALRPGGYLFLGASETVGDEAANFDLIDSKWKLYRRREGLSQPLGRQANMNLYVTQKHGDVGSRGWTSEREQADRLLTGAYEQLTNAFAPPSILVGENNEVLHLFGNVRKYLSLPAGKVSLDVTKLVDRNLAVHLSTGLHRARREGKEFRFDSIELASEDDESAGERLNVRLTPLQRTEGEPVAVVVSFEPADALEHEPYQGEVMSVDDSSRQRIADLEGELQYTKENLQATIEELETSNEELQATNEELLAANEELQSTNEELQSVNEELHTLNAEYQSKIQELTQVNADMDNLMESTDVGTLFLDGKLQIRKFTGPIAEALNILPRDVGRPIEHLALDFEGPNVLESIRETARSRQPQEETVQTPGGTWMLVRIQPYSSDDPDGETGGVVVSFIDIDKLKRTEAALLHERNLLAKIMQTSPVGIVRMDLNGRIDMANPRAAELLDASVEEMTERTYNDTRWQCFDAEGRPVADEELPFSRALREGRIVSASHGVVTPGDRCVYLAISAAPLFGEGGEPEGVVASFADMTELEEARSRIRALSKVRHAVVACEKGGSIAYWGANAAALLGREAKEVVGKNILAVIWPEDAPQPPKELRNAVEQPSDWHGRVEISRPNAPRVGAYLGVTLPEIENASPLLFLSFAADLEAPSWAVTQGMSPG